MKMIGSLIPCAVSSRCRSRPLNPGNSTSSTTHPGRSGRLLRRNSCAVPKVSTLSPANLTRIAIASRIDESSKDIVTEQLKLTQLVAALFGLIGCQYQESPFQCPSAGQQSLSSLVQRDAGDNQDCGRRKAQPHCYRPEEIALVLR